MTQVPGQGMGWMKMLVTEKGIQQRGQDQRNQCLSHPWEMPLETSLISFKGLKLDIQSFELSAVRQKLNACAQFVGMREDTWKKTEQ